MVFMTKCELLKTYACIWSLMGEEQHDAAQAIGLTSQLTKGGFEPDESVTHCQVKRASQVVHPVGKVGAIVKYLQQEGAPIEDWEKTATAWMEGPKGLKAQFMTKQWGLKMTIPNLLVRIKIDFKSCFAEGDGFVIQGKDHGDALVQLMLANPTNMWGEGLVYDERFWSSLAKIVANKEIKQQDEKKGGQAPAYLDRSDALDACLIAGGKDSGYRTAYDLALVDPHVKNYEAVCLAAVKRKPHALAYCRIAYPAVCLEAVKRDGLALQYAELAMQQNKEVCEAALENEDGSKCLGALAWVRNEAVKEQYA